ncbi:MAG: mono/diheme cytochrome c family protein [Cognaticolwellia sp.]|jgi:mono/diheme cytochrome c family protein|tara:strand:+ start:7 stop:363 length:357 start_codon:yes stop_codon:yes gene_type:complete
MNMKKIIIVVLALGFIFYACGSEKTTTSSTEAEQEMVASIPDGAKLYKNAGCIACHGAFGNPVLPTAKNLTDGTITLERRIQVVTNGSENNATMIAFSPKYSEAEIKAVAEYTMTFVE